MPIPSTAEPGIPPEVMADLEYAAELAASGRRDPEFARRIGEEAKRVREQVLQRNGVLDIGVSAIRELRDAE